MIAKVITENAINIDFIFDNPELYINNEFERPPLVTLYESVTIKHNTDTIRENFGKIFMAFSSLNRNLPTKRSNKAPIVNTSGNAIINHRKLLRLLESTCNSINQKFVEIVHQFQWIHKYLKLIQNIRRRFHWGILEVETNSNDRIRIKYFD